MNQFESFVIGFGDDRGQTSLVLLQEKISKIEIFNLRANKVENPKIEVKKFNQISLGVLQDCIRKKRDKSVLEDLLRVEMNCDVNKIQQDCQSLKTKLANDMALLGALMEQNNTDKFIQRTKGSGKQAQKYLSKYKDCEEAVVTYLKHQQIIKKFMQQNNCNRENAIAFLESNGYNLF